MNILFFHRLDLVHLYAPVSKELNENNIVTHVAFSDEEEQILKNQYGIESNIYNFIKIRDFFFDNKDLDISIGQLDEFIISNSDGRFNLNTSIHLDRTYKNLNLDECCQMSIAYFKTWKLIFIESEPSLFFHEPPAIFATHLASLFCRSTNTRYLTQIHVIGANKHQWIFLEGDNAFPLEIEINRSIDLTEIDYSFVDTFIDSFRGNENVLMAELSTNAKSSNGAKLFLFVRKIVGLVYRTLSRKIKKVTKVQPKNHFDKFLANNKKSFFVELENIFGRLYGNYHSQPKVGEKYFFYPLHLEPEAVVLYYADGWYDGQVKLIENIAMQLPSNVFLYVKDHPHGGEYRDIRDYKRIIQQKNVRLIKSDISGKKLIKNSLGVITINGTAGFEALLMQKYVFCFGRSFYSNFKGICYLEHIKQLKDAILKIDVEIENTFDDSEIESFLSSSHEGFVGYFAGRQNLINIDLNKNAILIACGIQILIDKLEKSN